MGLREQILSSVDVKLEPMSVPEWDVDIWLKSWSGLERGKALATVSKHDETSVAHIVMLSACDAEGVALFSDKDVTELGKKNGQVLERIALAACEFNGLNKVAEAGN